MFDSVAGLFDASGFPARWNCGTWSSALGWTHIVSDLLTWGAYTAIPLVLAYFIIRRGQDVPFPKLFWLFCAFIFACGTVHLVEATIFWWPIYRFSAVVKASTAVVSWGAVVALVMVTPKALHLPGLARINADLVREMEERRKAEERFRLALEASPSGVIMVDEAGIITLANAQAETMFGYSPGELINQPVEMLVPERFRTAHATYRSGFYTEAKARPMGSGRDLFALHKSGREFPVEIGLNPIQTPEGVMVLSTILDITERKRAERALRESEQLYRAIGESIDYGVWVCDAKGRNIYTSESFLQLVGKTQAECSNLGWSDLLHPEDSEATRSAWMECVESGSVWDREHRFRGADGQWHPVLARGVPVRDDAGRILKWVGINLDISNLKRIEADLRRSEARFRQLADSMPQIVWASRPDGYLDYYNKRWYEFTGAPQEMGGDESWKPILHPDDVQPCLDRWYHSIRTGEPYQIEYRFKEAATGQYRWHLGRALPVRDGAGDITRWYGTSTDIEDQKRTETSLSEHAGTLSILNRMHMALAAEFKLENVIQVVTDAATRLSGARMGAFFYNEESGGEERYRLYAVSGLSRGDFSRFPMPRITALFGETFRGERVVRLADVTQDPRFGHNPPFNGMPEGHPPVRSYLAVPVISRSGDVIGGLFLGHPAPDVFSEQAERIVGGLVAQTALAIDNARLYRAAEVEIAERKRAESALTVANEELQRRNSEMEQFVYTVSHDLKSPLVTTMGFVGLLREDLAAGRLEHATDDVERVERAAARMSESIDDLLHFSRVGRIRNEPEDVDVTSLLHEIAEELSERMVEAGATLKIEDGMPNVYVDRKRFFEVFENLLTNALKYGRNSGGTLIQVGSQVLEDEIRFFVRDNGPGIPQEFHEKIFGLFERLDSASDGTGVGLTIVAKVMQMHGGRTWIESSPGAGATFWLALPVHARSEDGLAAGT